MTDIRIDKSAFGGFGLAFSDGKALFVPGTIPGEYVRIGDPVFKKSVGFAQPISIIEPSPDRIIPECPVYGSCGGCDYLHMNYEREISEKQSIIIDSLKRIGKLPDELIPHIDVIRSLRFGYRSHASVKIDSSGKPGFYAKDSHTVIPFPEQGCLLLCPKLREALRNPPSGVEEIKAAVDPGGQVFVSSGDRIALTEQENGIHYQREIRSFFQANRFLRRDMIDEVLYAAHLSKDKTVLDLGCGCGFFSLPAAIQCKEAKGIDINAESIASAKMNAQRNGITNARFESKPDEMTHPLNDRADIVIADPPRAGLSSGTKKALCKMKPERIVYVSCNVTTWARDIKELLSEGYTLTKCTMIDMFPGTLHIEVISVLTK
jgi:tRNA/tmRNA/rRNA uracil-C5-methylase (TrmA/RlmC/RlmD family)